MSYVVESTPHYVETLHQNPVRYQVIGYVRNALFHDFGTKYGPQSSPGIIGISFAGQTLVNI